MNYLKIIALLFCINISIAQELTTTRKGGTVLVTRNSSVVKPKDLESLVRKNEELLKQIKSARTNKTFSDIFGFAGGFLIGYPLGQAIGGGEVNWELAGVGGGFVIGGLIFNGSYNKKITKFVDDYNTFRRSTASIEPEYNMVLNSNGIGISIRF